MLATTRPMASPPSDDEHAAAFSSGDDDAAFSDDGEVPPARSTEPFEDTTNDGFDFSGAIIADASIESCTLCSRALELRWDADRQALVYVGAAMLQHHVYHIDCLARRRGPSMTTASRFSPFPSGTAARA